MIEGRQFQGWPRAGLHSGVLAPLVLTAGALLAAILSGYAVPVRAGFIASTVRPATLL